MNTRFVINSQVLLLGLGMFTIYMILNYVLLGIFTYIKVYTYFISMEFYDLIKIIKLGIYIILILVFTDFSQGMASIS